VQEKEWEGKNGRLFWWQLKGLITQGIIQKVCSSSFMFQQTSMPRLLLHVLLLFCGAFSKSTERNDSACIRNTRDCTMQFDNKLDFLLLFMPAWCSALHTQIFPSGQAHV